MNLNNLPKTTTRSKTRRGRGYGSTVGGHTTGRGQKGQKSRSKISLIFEGGQLPLTKRLPYLRGKSRFNSIKKPTVTINLDSLNMLPNNSVVTKDSLTSARIISLKQAATHPLKILSGGKLEKKLTIKGIPLSKKAIQTVTKTGGKIEN